ncbi:MAG TPA: GNAT family N-acetyltransferase [Gaiellales bacterium]|jgi:ribosomal protein S18 acetylase RimI-like enzyme|nr:GNAT family N-acetyltransferase [Gaiellales bacterium]
MNVILRPMRADEYPAWAEQGARGYVDQMVEFGGMEREHAAAKAVRDFATVLPDGLETKGHWLFVIEAEVRAVGCLWFAERDLDGRPSAFLYDIQIDEQLRGHGYGRAAMLEFEREAARRGLHHLSLNVFGGNAPARGLYSSLGWAEMAITMTKHLEA